MLPNAEVGAPFTALWWLAVMVLVMLGILVGVISKLTVASVNRALVKRESFDADRENRVRLLDVAIREIELKMLQRDSEHDERLHDIQMEILRCKQEQCSLQGKYVTVESHHGDILRIEHLVHDKVDKIIETIGDLHRRVDGMMAMMGRRKQDWGREDE